MVGGVGRPHADCGSLAVAGRFGRGVVCGLAGLRHAGEIG